VTSTASIWADRRKPWAAAGAAALSVYLSKRAFWHPFVSLWTGHRCGGPAEENQKKTFFPVVFTEILIK
jgi:hypothetical protein